VSDSSGWWARKMGQQPPQSQAPRQYPQVPPQRPYTPPTGLPAQQYTPQYQEAPTEDPAGLSEALRTKQYRQIPREANAQASSAICPGCGSGNYMAIVPGTNAKGHCHDCGWPTVQAGSGMGSLGGQRGSGTAQPAASPTYDQQLGR
jgi:hypothetical protein